MNRKLCFIFLMSFLCFSPAISFKSNTLKYMSITKELSQSEILRAIKPFGNVAKSLGIVSPLVQFAFTFIRDEDELKIVLDALNDHMRVINEKLSVLEGKLNDINGNLDAVQDAIISRINESDLKNKLNLIIPYNSQINVDQNTLIQLFEDYQENSARYVHELDEFFRNRRANKPEEHIINLIDPPAASLFTELIKFYRQQNSPTLCDSKSTLAQEVFETYTSILMKVQKSFNILENAAKLANKVSLEQRDISRISHRPKAKLLKRWMNSTKTTLAQLKHEDFFTCVRARSDKGNVRFRNVLQIVFLGVTCYPTYYKVLQSHGCFGQSKECSSINQFHALSSNWKHSKFPSDDRIYEGFSYDSKWYGRGSESDSSVESVKVGNVCCNYVAGPRAAHCVSRVRNPRRCICDQLDHDKTLRKIYVGRIDAPNGFVVAGVRFAETPDAKSIFIQIQVGKLIPMGMIEPSSVYWLDFPKNTVEADYLTFKYENRPKLVLNNGLRFNDGVLTGIQLHSVSFSITLKIFGRKLKDFPLPSLDTSESYLIAPSDGNIVNKFGLGYRDGSKIFTQTSNGVIDFNHSSQETDAGQSFVPFFDGSDVTLSSVAPIAGVGIVHTTNDRDYAGYVSLIAASLNFNNLLTNEITENDFEINERM